MPADNEKLGYLCELNDPCKYIAFVRVAVPFDAALTLLTSKFSSVSLHIVVSTLYLNRAEIINNIMLWSCA